MQQGHDSMNTLECLRGRLLAERHASKLAKEEMESLCNKLVELEKELREEIKLRDKAERKLQLLKKKLQSSNMSSQSGQPYSSQKCEANATKISTVNPPLLENAVHNHNVLIQNHHSSFTAKDCGSQSSENLKNDENMCPI